MQVAHLARERREGAVSVEVLKEGGELCVTVGAMSRARSMWHDALDGLFTCIDTHLTWEDVLQKHLPLNSVVASSSGTTTNTPPTPPVPDSMSPYLPSLLPLTSVLANLSKFCSERDWNSKLNYCKFASTLLLTLLVKESAGNPQTLRGYAAYVCMWEGGIGGRGGLALDPDILTPHSITSALEEIVSVLTQDGGTQSLLLALPVCTVWEHYHTHYTLSPPHWLTARLCRIRVLARSHLYAEAASMFSSILPTIQAMVSQSVTTSLTHPLSQPNPWPTPAGYDTSVCGLDFHGRSPFFPSLPPHDNENKKACEWIAQFPSEFDAAVAGMRVLLPPPPPPSAEQLAAEEERRKAEEAEAAKTKGKGAKGGGKGAAVEAVPVTPQLPSLPLFDEIQRGKLALEAATFLVSLSCLDNRSQPPPTLPPTHAPWHTSTLLALTEQGEGLISHCINALAEWVQITKEREGGKEGGMDSSSSSPLSPLPVGFELANRGWVETYSRAVLLRASVCMRKRQLKAARGHLFR